MFGFTVILTIPGWIALNTYREWKRGQRGEPKLLIGWGVIASLLYSSAFVGVLVYRTTHESPREVAITTPGPPMATPTTLRQGFESSPQVNGWTRYTSDQERFSISLPPKWSPDVISDPGPQYKFIARDWGPPYRSDPGAGLWVSVWPVSGQEVPRTYWQSVRLRISRDPHTVAVEVSRTHLPAGNAFVFHVVTVRRGVSAKTTMYALLHGATDYRLLFEAPLKHANSYRSEFNDIALTFMLVG